MKHEIPVFDGDGHVLETDAGLSPYYEGKWKGNRRLDGLTIFPSLDGWSRSAIVQEGDEGRKHWSTDAEIWAEILDKVGLEGSPRSSRPRPASPTTTGSRPNTPRRRVGCTASA